MESTNEIEKLLGKMPTSLLWNGNLLLLLFVSILILFIFFIRVASIPLKTNVTILHANGLKNVLIVSYDQIELDKIGESVLLCANEKNSYRAKIISIDHFHKHIMIVAQDKCFSTCNGGDILVLKATVKETVYRKLKY